MNRLSRALLILVAALGLTLTAAPTQARIIDTVRTNCWSSADLDAHICVDVWYHLINQPYPQTDGIAVDQIVIRKTGGFFESKAFDCDSIRLWNDNLVVKWRKDGAPCDIYDKQGPVTFQPNVNMPDAIWARVSLAGWPKLDMAPDPGRITVGVTIS